MYEHSTAQHDTACQPPCYLGAPAEAGGPSPNWRAFSGFNRYLQQTQETHNSSSHQHRSAMTVSTQDAIAGRVSCSKAGACQTLCFCPSVTHITPGTLTCRRLPKNQLQPPQLLLAQPTNCYQHPQNQVLTGFPPPRCGRHTTPLGPLTGPQQTQRCSCASCTGPPACLSPAARAPAH